MPSVLYIDMQRNCGFQRRLGLRSLRPKSLLVTTQSTWIFLTCYAVSNGLYFWFYRIATRNSLWLFLTSPFNAVENYSSAYSSPLIGFASNYVFVVFLIAFSEILYQRYAKLMKNWVDYRTVFLSSVIASYIVGAITWRGGVPAHGTSIVSFCLILFLLVIVSAYSVHRYRTFKHNPNILSRYRILATMQSGLFIFILLLIAVFGFFVDNSGAIFHISGGLFFISTLGIIFLIQGLKQVLK